MRAIRRIGTARRKTALRGLTPDEAEYFVTLLRRVRTKLAGGTPPDCTTSGDRS